MSSASCWYRWSGTQLILNIRVVPRSKQDGIAGIHDDRLRVRIAAPPVDGRANARLVEFLARKFGVPKRAVTLLAGETSQRKRVAVTSPTRLLAGIEPAPDEMRLKRARKGPKKGLNRA